MVFSRRRFLRGFSLTAASVGTATFLSRVASAQDPAFAEQAKRASFLRQRIEQLSAELPLNPESYGYFAVEDYSIRVSIATMALKYEESALRQEISTLGHVDPDDFAKWDVPVAPQPDEIQRAPALPGSQVAAEAPKEDLFEVVFDILLESLGLAGLESSLREAASQLDGIEAVWKEVEEAASSGDAGSTVNAMYNFADYVCSREGIKAILGKVGGGTARPFLKALSIRCVPFVGPALVIVALGLAVTRNWQRLRAALA